MLISYLLAALPGFISGSVLYSYLLPKYLYKIDVVQNSGDHNPGTANVFKLAGPGLGMVCLTLDLAKGFFPVWIAAAMLDSTNPLFALVVAAPVCGHAFSPMLGGRGGKAIATAFGALLGLVAYTPLVWYLAAAMIALSCIAAVHPHRLRVMAAFALFVLLCLLLVPEQGYRLAAGAVSAVVICKHLPRQAGELAQVTFFPYARRRRQKPIPLCGEKRHSSASRRGLEKTAR